MIQETSDEARLGELRKLLAQAEAQEMATRSLSCGPDQSR